MLIYLCYSINFNSKFFFKKKNFLSVHFFFWIRYIFFNSKILIDLYYLNRYLLLTYIKWHNAVLKGFLIPPCMLHKILVLIIIFVSESLKPFNLYYHTNNVETSDGDVANQGFSLSYQAKASCWSSIIQNKGFKYNGDTF